MIAIKRNPKLLALLLSAAIGLAVVPAGTIEGYGAQAGEISVVINDESKQFSVMPVQADGTVFVPMRGIFEALGAQVIWSDALNEATAKKGDTSVVIKLGSTTAFVNNRVVTMTNPARMESGSTMVPIRFVSEAFGAEVGWDEATQKVTVTTPKEEASEPLSYNDAIKAGLKKSPDLNKALISADKSSSQNEDISITLGTYNLALLQTKKGLQLQDKWNEMDVAITGDQVSNVLRNQMDDISLQLESKKNLAQKIDFLKYKKYINTLLFQNGQISQLTLKDAESEYDMAVQSLKVLEKEIDSAYAKLNSTLGYPTTQKDTLEYEVTYEAVGEVDIDDKIRKDGQEDPYLWLMNQNVDLAEFNLTTYEFNAGRSWTVTKLDLTQAKQNLATTKDNYAKAIQSRYDNLKLIEENLKSIELGLDQAKRKIDAARIQYDLGMITKVTLEEAQRNVADLEYQMKELKQKHSQLKVTFDKPYLNPEYVSG